MPDYSDKFDFSLRKPKADAPEGQEAPGAQGASHSEEAGNPVDGVVQEPAQAKSPDSVLEEVPDDTVASRRVRRTKAVPFDGKLCRVNIPKNVVDMIQAMMPSAPTKPLAVMTYLYITMGRPPEFPDEIKDLGSQYEDDGGVGDLQKQVLDLTDELKRTQQALGSVSRQVSEAGMALLWLVAEKMGYNVNVTATPEEMEFLFPELIAMKQRLSKQAADMRNQEAAARGREMNAPHYKPPQGKG